MRVSEREREKEREGQRETKKERACQDSVEKLFRCKPAAVERFLAVD